MADEDAPTPLDEWGSQLLDELLEHQRKLDKVLACLDELNAGQNTVVMRLNTIVRRLGTLTKREK